MWLDDNQQRSNSNAVPEGIEELLLSQLRRPTPVEPSSHDGAESLQQKDEPDPLQNSENHAGEQAGVQGENNDNMLVSTPVSLPDMPRDSRDESGAGLIQERETSGTNEQMCEMQFEQNDGAVRDVEAVSQASSGSGATLGESLRSLEVEIGSVDGHDDGERQERQGTAERVPSGDLHQISRTRRSSGTVVPVGGRDASLESVSEVPAGPSQEANQNILLAENPVIRNADSDSIDPTFLEALPEELRAEVLSSRQNQVPQTSSDQSQAEGEIDPEFLAALPPDIREEVLAQQRAQRQTQPQELAGQPVEMDAVSIIATFPSEIREEVLLTSPDTLLATLTPALVAEANMLRERFAHRYHSNALLGLQPRSRRGDHSRRGDLIGSNTDRSAVASASRRSAAGKLIDAAGTPLVGTDALKALVRLLRVVQPLYKGQFQRLLLNLCAHQDTRTSLVQILMDMLMLDLRGTITTDTDVTDPPFRLTSNQGPGKAVRMEEDNPEETIGKGDFSVVVLLRLLNQPLYMRSIAHLEQDIQVNNEIQPVVQDVQPNATTPTGEGSSSMTEKNAHAVLTGLPHAELRLLCSLLAREGLSDNAYVLAAEVLKRLVAVVPTFCHLFILELAKSMHNLVASGMNELHLNDGETERALLASSTTCGTAILRVLQALGSLVSVLHDKKDPQLISENEYSGALFQVSEVNSSLESLWLELSSCISKIESSSDSTGDVDIILGNLANVSSSSPLPAGSQNILPYIESFFVTCEKLHPGQLDVNQELVIATASDLEDVSTSVKVDEKYGAFVKFSEKHRKLLNAFIRQNPGLLEKSFSLMLKVPRFIDFDNKRAHFRSKIKHQHDHHHSPVRISVRRAYILEDSYNQLRMRSPQDLKGRLTVHFQGEEGIDAGGLTREWYQLLSRVIFDKGALLFTTVGNESTFQPNPNSVYQTEHLSYFKFVGRVHILGVKVTYHDIEAIDPDYYKNLKWMLENDISDVLDLTFSVDADEEKLILYEKAESYAHDIVIRVTEESKRKYVDLVVEHRLTTAIRPQINAFLEGFNELTPRELISIFNDRELELLISGLPDIDLDDLRANTEYSGYSNASPIIQWFWDVLQVFSKEDKARFLQFVTGTSKVPLEGFSALQGISGAQRFQIHKAYGSPNHLPSAHTCFNQLDLPEYPSKNNSMRESIGSKAANDSEKACLKQPIENLPFAMERSHSNL
ncbi:hypothetical protein HPP92_024551 [Vanilla planifolia]|uniref:HECT-type E3 ubiquitin transferase n=1 Tax=Vanilla planifolia TaxID=51239 RepID=A0A835UA10_VANPL|nr:hypothetical protein HPP92_024551 [Vanilla planifolia]